MNKEVEKKETATTTVPRVTDSDKIWEEVQNLPIAMFALPAQSVKQHVQRIKVSQDALYLRLNSPAVVASLEEALADSRTDNRYSVELAEGGYVIVKRAAPPIVLPKVVSKD